MAYIIGETNRNCLLVSRLYPQRFPGRRHPAINSLQKLEERFDNTGIVAYANTLRGKRVLIDENHKIYY